MSRVLLTLVLCAALVTQLLASTGLFSNCRCTEEPDSCRQAHRQATAQTGCCCHQESSRPSCCHPEKSNPGPCPCRVGQSPDAVPSPIPVPAERVHVMTFHRTAAPDTLLSLSSCAGFLGNVVPVHSPPGHRLQSLLCIWTI